MSVIKLSKNDIIKNKDSNENDKIKLKKNQISYDSTLINEWESTNKASVETINSYYERLNKNEWLSPDDYSGYRKALDDYISSSTSLRGLGKYSEEEDEKWNESISSMNSTYDTASKLHSEFDSAEDFITYFENAKKSAERNEKLKSLDLESARKEIEELERKSEQVQARISGINQILAVSGQSRMSKEQIAKLQAEKAELEKQVDLVAEKRAFYNQAKYIQDGLKMAGVADPDSEYYDPNFDEYSKYVSTEREGDNFLEDAWNRLTSDYGLGYEDVDYEYINADEDKRKAINRKYADYSKETYNADRFDKYKYMTEDEIAIYNYYYSKEGKGAADTYINSITETLNIREANKRFEYLEDNTVLELLFGVEAGYNQFASGIAEGVKGIADSLAGYEGGYNPQSSTQMLSGMVREDLDDVGFDIFGNSLGQMGFDVITTTTNMLPSIMVSTVANQIVPGSGAIVGSALLGASAAGNARAEMKRLGYTNKQANAYGLLVGASEAGLQYLLGGISSLGGKASGGLIKLALSKVDNAFARVAIQLGGNMAFEGLEEGLQTILDPWFKSIVTGADFEAPNIDEVLYSSLLGALSAGLLEGGSTVSSEVSIYKQGKSLLNQGVSIENLSKFGSTFSADSVAYRLAGKVNENTGAYTIARLFNEVNAQLTEQNQNDIIRSLERKGITSKDAKTIATTLAQVVAGAELTETQANVLENNPDVAKTFQDVIINANSTVNQRMMGLREAFKTDSSKTSQETTGEAKEVAPIENTPIEQNAENEAIKVSESGKTTQISTGKEINIKEIASIKDGEVTLLTEDGETVSASDVEYGSKAEALIYENVVDMNMNAATANAFVRGYDPSEGLTVEEYANGFREAYTYGQYSYPVQEMSRDGFSAKLSEAKKSLAYNLGKTDAKYKVSEKQKAVSEKKRTVSQKSKGKVHYEDGVLAKGLTDRQSASLKGLETIADALGVEFHIFESRVENGKRKGANGWFDPKDGSIHIDLYAGLKGEGTILFTAAHELTHFIREWSPAKFKVFADFLLEQYGKKGISVDALVREQIAKAKRNGRDISYDTAYEEVIADSCEAMLADGDAISKIAKLKAKDKSLWQKIKDFITDLVAKIKKVYQGLLPDSIEGRYVAEMLDSAEQLKALWTDALVDASDSYSKAETVLAENGIAVDSKTESASLMSVRDVLDDKQREKVAKTLATRFDVTHQEATDWLKAETSLASLILNPKYSQYLDYTADENEEAIKSNSDYPQGTVDFSNICKKRRDFTEIMNRILRSFPNHIFEPTDLAKIRTIMEQEGMEVACAICYVEDRRQLDSVVAQDFINSLALYREGSQTRPDGKPFNANQLKALKLIDGSAYTPSIYELISLKGRNELKAKNPAMEEAWVKFNNARGMQSVRLLLNDAEYKRQILKYNKNTVKSKNDNGGLRIYSFSDMEMFHLIDIIQVITDSATVGLSIQGYTKVNEYAKAVKDTGEKLNRSLIPKGDLGYHMEKGKVVLDFDTVEGIDINHPDFFDSTDNPNVGNIVIGINPTQIRAAMMSKFIDYIIPFHTGQSKEVLGEKGIAEWVNYKDSQTEKDLSTGKTSKHQINIYTEVIQDAEKAGKPITNKVEFVNKFLEVCKENNLVPRFSEFLNMDENGNYVYTEGYHKFLVDFKTFDSNTGEYLPQKPVKPIFDSNYLTKLLRDYVKTQQVKDAEFTEKSPKVLERITNEIIKPNDTKFSDRDSLGNELSKEQQEFFKDSKVRDNKGNLKVVYHGTKANFNVFAKGDIGFHFGTKGAARGRVGNGKNAIIKEVYLNITNPVSINKDLGSWNADTLAVELFNMKLLTRSEAESVLFTDDKLYRRSTDSANKKLREMLLQKGYDGIEYRNTFESKKDSTSYIAFNSNQVKEISNAKPTPSADIRYSDRDYLDAVNKGDMETAQKMVDEAAKKAGYTIKAYHGTNKFGFTKADVSYSDDGISFFATDSKETASTYSGDTKVKRISDSSKQLSDDDIEKMEDDIRSISFDLADYCSRTLGIRDWVSPSYFKNELDDIFFDLEHSLSKSKGSDATSDFIDFCDNLFYEFEQAYYDSNYDSNNNPYLKEDEWVAWEDWEVSEEHDEIGDKFYSYVAQINAKLKMLDYDSNSGMYDLYTNANGHLILECNGSSWNNIKAENLPESLWNWNTRKVAKYAKENGFTGVTFKDIVDSGDGSYIKPATVYIFFNPQEQVKSADPVTYDADGNVIPLSERFNADNNDIRYSGRDSYAPTFYSYMGKVVDGIKSEKVGAGGVVSYLKGKGVKNEEIKWSGIETWLEGKKSVTKAELQEFIRGSQLRIEEEMSSPNNWELVKDGNNWVVKVDGEIRETWEYTVNPEDPDLVGWMSDISGDIVTEVEEIQELLQDEYGSGTRWSEYKLDGGTNYRELVFQMPNSSYSNRAMRVHWGQDAEGVLVHTRVQDFDIDGKKMLFVEELQSDWHNEGHSKGYSTKEYEDAVGTYDKLYNEYKKMDLAFHKYVRSNEFMTDPEDVRKKKHGWLRSKAETAQKKYLDAEKAVNSLKENGAGDTPNAPFKDTYHEYVLKRLLRMASEEGYDSIGWTPAKIQEERWSDEFAEGYRIEYDQDIPSFLKKYGKKWGATVGKTTVNDTDVWSMDITDSMKESVLYEGQVMYSDRVTDQKTLDFLENQDHITTYKSFVEIDGKLYSPMATQVKGKDGKYRLTNPSEIGVWQQAEEKPENIKKFHKTNGYGYFDLKKDNGKTVLAAYNPYEHSSNLVLNDQFEEAYQRPNLVTVECVIPKSEMTSGYKAKYAKDSTGYLDWKSGTVAGKMKGNKRKVYLSRWLKPVRILSDAEVASMYKEMLGTSISVPFNVVSPSLLTELEKVGVKVDYEGSPMYKSIQKRKATDETTKLSDRYDEGLSEADKKLADEVIRNLKDRVIASKYGVRNMATYTPERMDREISTSSSDTVIDYAKSYITWVNPIDFVYATTTSEQFREKLKEEAGELNIEKLRRETQPIHLTVDFETGEIVGHEGRHRMLALSKAGIREVAVIIDAWNDDRHNTKPISMMHLKGQRFAEYKKGVDFFLHNMLPLSKRYADVVTEIFTHDSKRGVKFSDRDNDSVSNRSLLANALESVAQNDIEKNKLKQYKDKIQLIESEQAELSQIRAEIKELSFAKGKRDTVKIKDLQNEATRIANRINTYDRQLLNLESTTALKNVLQREKEMAYKKAEQRGKEALAKYREKASATQRELLTRYQESRKNATEGRHKTEVRNKIKKVVSDLNKLLLNPTKEQHVPIGLQRVVAEALDAINMDTMNAEERVAYYNDLISKSSDPDEIAMLTKKRDFFEYRDMNFKDRITALKNAYAEFKESNDPLIRNAHNDAIEDLIKNTADSVGNKSLKDMSYEQLEAVYNMYKAILATVRNSNKMFKEGIQATITETSESVKVQVKEVGGHKDRVNKLMKPIKQFGWNMLKPVTAMKVIGSKTFEKLFNNVRAGEDTWAVDVNEAKNFYQDKAKNYNFKKWDFKKRHSFKDSRGNDFSLSLEQIMSLYAYSKRSQADKHLELGGFIFDDAIEVTEKKFGIPVKYEVNDANPYRINIEIMGEIASTLTEEQRNFVDEMQAYLSDVMGEKGNEVSLAMYDIKLYNEKHYFPLKSSRYFREFDSEQSATPKIKNSGFSKKTVPQAGNPIVLSNFMDVWASHVNEMSMYHAFVLPLEDFMRVYNYSSTAGGYDSVQQYIKNAYGSQANQYIEKLMVDLNGGARVDSTAGVINKGLSLFKKASVFASASVVIQQPSSIARALAYINPKYFVTSAPSAINLIKHKQVWAEIKKYAPVAVIKEMGYFDTGMGRSTVDWIKGNQTIKDKVDDALSKAPAMADELSWAYIWEAIKRETKATTNLEFGSEAFLKKCGERFTEIITNTQVYDSVLSRSGMMRSKDTGMKMATAFMAEPTTTVNMMVDGFVQGKRGNKKFLASTVGAVSASIILNSILVALVYAARDDDEDETYAEKYIGSLTTELIDGFNPLTYIPFVKDIWSIAQGYDVERSDMSVISDLWATVEGLFNKDKKGWEKVSDVVGAVASVFGLPLKNLIRDAKGIYNLAETIFSGTPTTGAGIGDSVEDAFENSIPLWGRFNESETKSDKLYDAILSGNQNQIDRIKGQFKDEKAIESAMKQGLRENDPRIKEAAQAVLNGNPSERGRIAKEIIAEGNFSMKTVTAAINAELDKLRKRKKEENKKASN